MKLIDLLVKELPNRGGWPVNISYIAQDEGSATWGFRYKPERDSDGEWMDTSESGYEMRIDRIGAADDCNTSVVSRKQYESALAASKAVVGRDGWIQWAGGECPVDSDAIVEVKFRRHNQRQYNNDRAGDFDWACTGRSSDIIAYRLHDHGINHRANDDRLEQDLNECIGQDFAPEWDGEGLPPVGIKCEHCPGGTTHHEWEIVTVAGVHENTSTGFTDYWLVRENGSSYIVGNPYRFRPLRTEAEKLRESAINDIATLIGRGTFFQDAERIYDAIAAGKIPGVKLEGK